MIRRWTELMCLVLVWVTVAGCGRGNDASTGVVRYMALGAKVKTLDPADIGDTTSSSIGGQLYDTLYQYHFLKRPYELVPSLASEMPQVSADGLTITIKLRNDVVFQDDACFPDGKGRRLTANDVIFSWKRLADVTLVSKNWWVFDGHIAGLNEFRQYTSEAGKGNVDYDRPMEGLQAIDDHTLQIKLTRPWPEMVYLLAHLPTAVVAREAVQYYGDEFLNHPVGTGAFRLTRWDRGSLIILERNPTYREEYYPTEGEPGDEKSDLLADAGKRLPLIDRAEIRIIEEDQPLWLLFMQGKLDASGIPKDNFNTAITAARTLTPELQAKGILLNIYEEPASFWWGINMDDPVVGKNLPLRQAMNAAFDRADYIDKFLNGRGVAAHGFLPPMMREYNPELNSPYTTYDPELAKRKLKEAEQIHGGPLPKIVISMPGTDTTVRQMGEYFQRSMEKIGLAVEMDYMDWPTMQQKVDAKSTQIYAMGWVADYPDASNFMAIFYGPNESPGPNSFNYKKPEFDALLNQAMATQDQSRRTEIYRRMEQMVVDDLPFVLSIHPKVYALRYPWLKNSKSAVFGSGMLKYQNIDVELRRKMVGR